MCRNYKSKTGILRLATLTGCVVIWVLVTGCESVHSRHARLLAVPDEDVIASPEEAVLAGGGDEIQNGKKRKVVLDNEDRTLIVFGERSYYQLFSFKVNSMCQVTVSVRSNVFTAVTGFNRELGVIVPYVVVADSTGTLLDFGRLDHEFKYSFWSGYRYDARWFGFVDGPGTYYIVVAADNREIEKRLAEGVVESNSIYQLGYSWRIVTSPAGYLIVKVEFW